ncbi:hypothetical protein JOD02_000637 [Caldicoprobacter guelmensis]|uniref:hypothetical protein n=1 Tax=Caldicoprobacter guelmensis TaxID=1170224 RepID=UPI001956D7C2|nr:hypothetical protein [Caldicoprobacter guelmensis]MBM7581800.1 hypothetical protein [Caldicoprobacter guelmensis]
MCKLYSLSDNLKKNVLDMAKMVENHFDGLVKFEEYIVLPDYGAKIIIRFGLTEDNCKSLEELDEIESTIRNILGNDYWGILLGNSYEKFGFNSSKMIDSLINIDLIVDDKVVQYKDTSYSQHIKRDKEIIKNILNLSSQQKIWEIQVLNGEDVDALILIVDEGVVSQYPNEKLFEREFNIGELKIKAICFKYNRSFDGIVKAYFIAEQSNLSVAHVIMKYQQV